MLSESGVIMWAEAPNGGNVRRHKTAVYWAMIIVGYAVAGVAFGEILKAVL